MAQERKANPVHARRPTKRIAARSLPPRMVAASGRVVGGREGVEVRKGSTL
jgi:hypothetical protein